MCLRRLAALTRPFRLLAIESRVHSIKGQDAHARHIPLAIQTALREAKLGPEDIEAYAFTQGPGMYGCLSCGTHAANAMAAMTDKPIVNVHHMQAHALIPLLTGPTLPQFPFLNLLVSGGHTLLVLVIGGDKVQDPRQEFGRFHRTAKLLNITWLPGLGPGPSLEHYASSSPDPQLNNATETLLVQMPRFKPAVRGQFAFSFAGMKTQVMKETAKHWPNLKMKGMPEHMKRAVARRFQE
ncbi:Mitochondrial tRNAs modification protein, partial [Naganishia albida]